MNKQTIISIVAIALISIAFVLYTFSGSIYNTLNAWDLIPKPEKFTELYFDNASLLPRTTVAGEPISFTFTIHNVEGTTTVYTYIVYFEDQVGGRTIFTGDNIALADGSSTTVNVTHTFAASDEQGEVVVDLPALNQQIDFLLPNVN
jgi:hypothetical protein